MSTEAKRGSSGFDGYLVAPVAPTEDVITHIYEGSAAAAVWGERLTRGGLFLCVFIVTAYAFLTVGNRRSREKRASQDA